MSATPEPAGSETDFNAIAAQLRHFRKDTNYIQAHWGEWKEEYPDHHVLVYGEKLISASTDLKEAIRLAEDQGVDPRTYSHGILLNRHLRSDPQVSHMAIEGIYLARPAGYPAPFLHAVVELPRVELSNEVDFLVDTGADNTVLHSRAVERLRIDRTRL